MLHLLYAFNLFNVLCWHTLVEPIITPHYLVILLDPVSLMQICLKSFITLVIWFDAMLPHFMCTIIFTSHADCTKVWENTMNNTNNAPTVYKVFNEHTKTYKGKTCVKGLI